MSFSIDSESLRKKLRERMNQSADHVSGGGCSDWADYRYATGVVAGLAMAERDLLDLVEIQKKLGGDEDE